MKKFFLPFISLLLLIGIVGCKGEGNDPEEENTDTSISVSNISFAMESIHFDTSPLEMVSVKSLSNSKLEIIRSNVLFPLDPKQLLVDVSVKDNVISIKETAADYSSNGLGAFYFRYVIKNIQQGNYNLVITGLKDPVYLQITRETNKTFFIKR